MKTGLLVSGAVVGIIALSILTSGIAIVDSGEVGVIYSFGKVSNNVLSPGLNFKMPFFTSVKSLDIKSQAVPEEFSALSKDGQQIRVTATTTYNNNPEYAAQTATTIGLDNEKIRSIVLQPRLLSAVKNIVAKYSMEQIISNQSVISDEIESTIESDLERQPSIQLTSVNVTGLVLDEQVQQSIENKIIATQRQQQALIEKETAAITAETNKVLSASITPILVQQEAVRKWDGKSAVFGMSGNNPVILQAK